MALLTRFFLSSQVLLSHNNASNDFKFDRCFDQDSSQADVFDEVSLPRSCSATHPTDHVSATCSSLFTQAPLCQRK